VSDSTCPDYYTLADGEEFADYSHRYVTYVAASHKVSNPFAIHCIISGLEHMYRRGHKTEDMSHDLAAAEYWFSRAKACALFYAEQEGISTCIDFLCYRIEQERRKKWPHLTD